MAKMTNQLAEGITPTLRADILFRLDQKIREEIADEDVIMWWLEDGIPDGTSSAEDILSLDLSAEEFTEIWNLAEKLLNKYGKLAVR